MGFFFLFVCCWVCFVLFYVCFLWGVFTAGGGSILLLFLFIYFFFGGGVGGGVTGGLGGGGKVGIRNKLSPCLRNTTNSPQKS